jgi:hypothetical protein
MTQYMLSVWHAWDEASMPEPEVMQQMFADVEAVNQDIKAKGQWVFGGGLMPPDSATVVRSTDGSVAMTDGPFAETKEMLGGFWIVELPDLDAALELAGRATVACRAPIEVRPFQDEPGA